MNVFDSYELLSLSNISISNNKIDTQVIHNGQKIYPLKDKEKEAFEDESEEENDGKSCFTAKNVNMSFIIAFPIAFIIFVCYMIIQVTEEALWTDSQIWNQVQLYPHGMREGGKRIDL